jgi:hypothetical protein
MRPWAATAVATTFSHAPQSAASASSVESWLSSELGERISLPIDGDDERAFAQITSYYGPADAASRTEDQSDLVGQYAGFCAHSVAGFGQVAGSLRIISP